MVGQIVALLVLLLFCAALYMSFKNWRITHVLLLLGIFIATSTFLVFAAMSLKTNDVWRKKFNRLTKDIENTRGQIAMLESGDELNPDATPDTIPRLKRRLDLQLVGRGRVWRGVKPAGASGNSVVVDLSSWGDTDCQGRVVGEDEELEPEVDPVVTEPITPEPEPAQPEATDESSDDDAVGSAIDGRGSPDTDTDTDTDTDAGGGALVDPVDPVDPTDNLAGGGTDSDTTSGSNSGGFKPHGIETGAVVYGFLEVSTGSLQPALRKVLFGDQSLPRPCAVPAYYLGSFVVTNAQAKSLTIEPVVPLDAGQRQIIAQQQGKWTLFEVIPIDGHDLAESVGADELPALFPNLPDVVAEYARDMQPAAPDDAPEHTFVKVKMLKEHQVAVDSDAPTQDIKNSFDSQGRAALPYLMQGFDTTLSEGDELFVVATVADKWVTDGIAERSADPPLFARPLRNYDIIFLSAVDKMTRMIAEMEVFKKDNATIITAAEKARKQIAFRESELARIGQDQGNIDSELNLLSRYQNQVRELYQSQRKTLSALYRANTQSAEALRGAAQAVND